MLKNILFLFFIAFMISCNSNKNKALDHFVKATNFFKLANNTAALSEIELAIKIDTANLDYKILKAKIKTELNSYDEAIQILKFVLTKKYKADSVNYLIGDNYFRIGNYYTYKSINEEMATSSLDSSVKYFTHTISDNPYYFSAYSFKLKALHNSEKFDIGLITLNDALKIFPDSMTLIMERGIEKQFLGDKIGALVDLNKSIFSNKLDSIDAGLAYRFRGTVFSSLDSLDRAINDLTVSLSFDPKNELAYVERGSYYQKKGLKNKACDDFRKAADLGYTSIYATIKEYCSK